MSHLIHFYFGDRKKAFETGLGSIIRAWGHSHKSKIIVFNNDYTWINELADGEYFQVRIVNKAELTELNLNLFVCSS